MYSNQDIGGGISTYEVHQVAKQKIEMEGRNRRFDVTLLINGMPIAQSELKQAKPLKYGPEMKRQWRKTLDECVVPLDDELK